jgi:hypothetical protein
VLGGLHVDDRWAACVMAHDIAASVGSLEGRFELEPRDQGFHVAWSVVVTSAVASHSVAPSQVATFG